MSLDLLGEGFDLHGGGEDLAFPHHENERAQAEGAGHPFARHWIHTGMVTIGGDKMSKSLGNFTTVEDALTDHDWRALRLAMLQTHYRRAADLGATELDRRRAGRSSASTRCSAGPTPAGIACVVRGRSRGARRASAVRWTTTSTPRTRWRSCSKPRATPTA